MTLAVLALLLMLLCAAAVLTRSAPARVSRVTGRAPRQAVHVLRRLHWPEVWTFPA